MLCPGILYNASRQTMQVTTTCIIKAGASRRISHSHSLHSGTGFSVPSGPAEMYLPATSALASLHKKPSMPMTPITTSHTPTPQIAPPKTQNLTKTICETQQTSIQYHSKTASLSLQPEKQSSKQRVHGSRFWTTTRMAGHLCSWTKRTRRKRRGAL